MLSSSSAFENGTRKWLNLRAEHLQGAVEAPDRQEVIDLRAEKRGTMVRLYLKSFVNKGPTKHVLVITNQPDGGREAIMDAWYYPKSLSADNATPLDVLSSLCQNFGLRIRIAGLTDRLIYSQKIIPPPGQRINVQPELMDKPSGNVKLNAFVRPNEDGSIDVALACAIDVAALKRKLARQP